MDIFKYEPGDVVKIARYPNECQIVGRTYTEDFYFDDDNEEEPIHEWAVFYQLYDGSEDKYITGVGENHIVGVVQRANPFGNLDERSLMDRALDKLIDLRELKEQFGDKEYDGWIFELEDAMKTGRKDLIEHVLYLIDNS